MKAVQLGLAVLLLAVLAGCAGAERQPVKVFIAGSLVVPFAELERAYEELHPEIDIQVEAHGSIQVIRYVTEIHEEVDVVVSADYALIPLLMYTNLVPETGQPYADWYLRFATNRLALAYHPGSRYASEINAENWFEIIARPDVRFGLSDPRFDAAGYRSLMVVQLAESYYQQPTIFEQVYLGQFETPLQVQKEAGQDLIYVPELLAVRQDARLILRGSSVALLALLASGDVDYAFEYESVIHQHQLNYLPLPAELNLGEPALADFYSRVQVLLDFQRFSSVTPQFTGEPIAYGLTIPSNAPQPAAAEAFVAFVIGPEGQAVLRAANQPILELPEADNYAALPAGLKLLSSPRP